MAKCNNTKQEVQLPLRERGVNFVHSSHHNATVGHLAFFTLRGRQTDTHADGQDA